MSTPKTLGLPPELYREYVELGLIDPNAGEAFAWELKKGALARFTSEELLRELKERSNRRIIEINSRIKRAEREKQ